MDHQAITPTLAVWEDLPTCAFFLTCDPNSVGSGPSLSGDTGHRHKKAPCWPSSRWLTIGCEVWFYWHERSWAMYLFTEPGVPAFLCWTLTRSFIWDHNILAYPVGRVWNLRGSLPMTRLILSCWTDRKWQRSEGDCTLVFLTHFLEVRAARWTLSWSKPKQHHFRQVRGRERRTPNTGYSQIISCFLLNESHVRNRPSELQSVRSMLDPRHCVQAQRSCNENLSIPFLSSLFLEPSRKPRNLASIFLFIFGWWKLTLMVGKQVFKNHYLLISCPIPNPSIAFLGWIETTSHTFKYYQIKVFCFTGWLG